MASLCAALLISAGTQTVRAQTKTKADTAKNKMSKVQYTCPMHPDVISGKPGKCSKCGMTLVKKETTKKKADAAKMGKMKM